MLLTKGADGRVYHSGYDQNPMYARPLFHRAPCGMTMKAPLQHDDSDIIDYREKCGRSQCRKLRAREEKKE